MKGNVHLEMRETAEKWGARIGCMSRMNGEMDRGRHMRITSLAVPGTCIKCGGQEGRQHARTWKRFERTLAGNW